MAGWCTVQSRKDLGHFCDTFMGDPFKAVKTAAVRIPKSIKIREGKYKYFLRDGSQ